MHQVNLKAKVRQKNGKEFCKKIRRQGMVPGIVYGKKMDNIQVMVDAKDLQKTVTTSAGTRVIINLEIEKDKETEQLMTMVTEIQKDIYHKKYYHVDFHKISLDEKVHTDVPVVLVGEAKGVKAGGVMDHILWQVPVKALPLDIPEKIELDVTNLDENEHFLVKDLKVSDKVEILLDKEETVVVIHPPKVIALETEGAAAAETAEAKPAEAAAV